MRDSPVIYGKCVALQRRTARRGARGTLREDSLRLEHRPRNRMFIWRPDIGWLPDGTRGDNGIRKDRSGYRCSGPSSRALCSLIRAALLNRRPPRVPERAYYSIIVRTMSECAGAPAGLTLGRLGGAASSATTSRSTHTTVATITAISTVRWSNLAIIALSFLPRSSLLHTQRIWRALAQR
jgi:hypothetical protein